MREITWIAIAIFIYILYRYSKYWYEYWNKYLKLPKMKKLITVGTVNKRKLSFSENCNFAVVNLNMPSELKVLKICLDCAFKYSDEQIMKVVKKAIKEHDTYYVSIGNNIADHNPYGSFVDRKIQLEIDNKSKKNPTNSKYHSEYVKKSILKSLSEYRRDENVRIFYYERYIIFDKIEKIVKKYKISRMDANIRLAWLRCGMKNDFRKKMVRYWEFMEENKQVSESEYNAILDEMYDFV